MPGHSSTPAPASSRRAFAMRPVAVFAAWLAFVFVSLLVLPLTGGAPAGPDDWMRLFEVRDWLGGQSWWDVTQYRIAPPRGASMHWSRLVDLPLAGVIVIAGLALPYAQAEAVGAVVVPLLYLLAALFALRAIMLRLRFAPLAMGFGLVVLPLFPLLPGVFAPFHIDHHAPQAVLGLACAALLLDRRRWSAPVAGVLAAAWVVISLEGLPLVAVLAGLYGLRYWLDAHRGLNRFLPVLAVAAPLLSLATRPASAFALPYCDILMPGHMAAFALAGLIALVFPRLPGQDNARGRLLALAAIPLLCAPLAFVTLGTCATNPMAELDPLLQRYWYGMITEGLPVWRQTLSVAAMLVWTGVLVAGAWWLARRQAVADPDHTLDWTMLALFALAAAGYSLLLMREGVVAQLLAIPFSAYLLAHFLPRARALASALPRILATLACFFLATPMFASALFKPLDRLVAGETVRARAIAAVEGRACDYSRLDVLEPGVVFAPLDAGPEILGRSDHAIVAASYHRNQPAMAAVIAAFTSAPEDARKLVAGSSADYVLACLAEGDFALYRTASQTGFAQRLATDKAPGWLEPVPGFEGGSLRVWRVR